MPEPIVLRLARPSDADALAEIARSAYSQYVELIGRPPAPMLADYARQIVEATVWVVEADDRPLGFLVTRPMTDHLLLDNVAVVPRAQGVGLGSLLLDRAEQDAAAANQSEIRL